ncbi:MAG: hypothetical protein R3F50_20275 [Gammaproteobacteria bacterium]
MGEMKSLLLAEKWLLPTLMIVIGWPLPSLAQPSAPALLLEQSQLQAQPQARIRNQTQSRLTLTVQDGSETEPNWNDYYQAGREESLLEEARLALSESRFQEAERLLDQALQVNRASYGLHNPSQLGVLDAMLEAQLVQQNWTEFGQRLEYIDWLNRRLYAEHPERLAAGLQRLSRWHRAAAAVVEGTPSAWYLIQGKYLDWRAVSILERQFGRNDKRLAPILYQIALTHFYQTVSIERRGMTSFDFKTEEKKIANGWMSSRSETVRRSYRIGRDNLRRIQAIYAADSNSMNTSAALLKIHLADWEFLYGNSTTALQLYREAYAQLLEAGVAESAVDAYFARLQVLPEQQLLQEWQFPEAGEEGEVVSISAWSRVYPGAQLPVDFQQSLSSSPHQVRALLEFEVQADSDSAQFGYGIAGMEFIDVAREHEQAAARASLEIPLLSFRPRLKAGELVAHDPVLLDYTLAPD